MNLLEQFNLIAQAVNPDDRARVFASLLIGAELALDRIKVVSSSYVSGTDVEKVIEELDGDAGANPVPTAQAPATVPVGQDDEDVIL